MLRLELRPGLGLGLGLGLRLRPDYLSLSLYYTLRLFIHQRARRLRGVLR